MLLAKAVAILVCCRFDDLLPFWFVAVLVCCRVYYRPLLQCNQNVIELSYINWCLFNYVKLLFCLCLCLLYACSCRVFVGTAVSNLIVIIIAKCLWTNLLVRGMCKVQKCKDDNVQEVTLILSLTIKLNTR